MMQSISTHFRLSTNHKQTFVWQNSTYARITDVKTATIIMEFLKLMEQVFKTIKRLITCHFCSPTFNLMHFHKHEVQKTYLNNNNNNDRLTAFDPGQPG